MEKGGADLLSPPPPPRLSDFRSTTATSLINLSEQCIQMHVSFYGTVHESVETNSGAPRRNRIARARGSGERNPPSTLFHHFLPPSSIHFSSPFHHPVLAPYLAVSRGCIPRLNGSSDTASRAPRQCNAQKSRLASHLRFLFQPGLLAEKLATYFPSFQPLTPAAGITRILLVMKAPSFPPAFSPTSCPFFQDFSFHIDDLLGEFRVFFFLFLGALKYHCRFNISRWSRSNNVDLDSIFRIVRAFLEMKEMKDERRKGTIIY